MKRPRLALPFSILPEPDTVRLIAGEDVRYTFRAPGLDRWLPRLLASLDGRTLEEALKDVDPAERDSADRLVRELYGERVLVDGPAPHPAAPFALEIEGPLFADPPRGTGRLLRVLAQDRLDYGEALRFNRRHRDAARLWVTTGPMSRGFVSPVFLPDAGPCLGCLVRHFERRSPAAELYPIFRERGAELAPSPFPDAGLAVLRSIVLWKAAALAEPDAPPALYRLHVLELSTMEVSTHRVRPDPRCPDCSA